MSDTPVPSTRREEVNLEMEYVNLQEALDAAKDNYNGEEEGPTQKALKDAEWAVAEFRIKWRGIRDYVVATQQQVTADDGEPDGIASPKAVRARASQSAQAPTQELR